MLADFVIGALAIACAVNGGIFFAFSSFVMRALGDLPPAAGIRAMQSINVVAVTPVFMITLFGTAAACIAAAAYAVIAGSVATPSIVAAASIHVLGTIVVTIVANVPLNNALARLDPVAGDAVWRWARYRRQWLAWNHIRAGSGIVAAGLFAYALVAR